MSQSTQYNVEDAVSDILGSVPGLNVYKSNRIGKRLFPYATVQCSINGQLIGPYSGVYDLNVAINYSDTAAKITQENFDAAYCQIFESLYEETPSLAFKIQDQVLNTKIFMARIISQAPTIRTEKDAWQRGLTLNVIATPDELSDGLREYDFSDSLNSFYLGTI